MNLLKLFIFPLLTLSLLLLSCKEIPVEGIPLEEEISLPEEPVAEEPEVTPLEEPETEINLSCTHNENCTWGKLCIQGKCQVLSELYPLTEGCEKECKFTKVEILTSDGETYTLSPGQGSYTAVSALEWTILSAPKHCQGEKPPIPINILKRNYQNIFSDEVILLKVGQTSPVITHPFVKRIAFTLTVQNITEVCS